MGVGDFVLSGEQKKMEGPLKVGVEVGLLCFFCCFGGDSRRKHVYWCLNCKSLVSLLRLEKPSCWFYIDDMSHQISTLAPTCSCL